MTHERKMTMKPDGTLYPSFYQRVLPGDFFKGNTEIFGRMLPLVNPVFQRFDVFVHYFFVPDRLIWDNFEEWISPQFTTEMQMGFHEYPSFGVRPTENPMSEDGAADIANFKARSLADCFGIQLMHDTEYGHLPLAKIPDIKFSSLPFRAYQLIWNEHYRDPDIQDPILVTKTDGYSDAAEDIQFRFLKRNWEKDYFTSARPFAQKGSPVVVKSQPDPANPDAQFYRIGDENKELSSVQVDENGFLKSSSETGQPTNVWFDDRGQFTIEQLRWANHLQTFYEKLYRGGTRYTNYLRNFFGVKSSDARLDRPEYIGGGRQPFTIGEVLQTTPTETSPLEQS